MKQSMHKWNFMVYMAGDNGTFFRDGKQLMADLQDYGWKDIAEMAQIGSTTDVIVTAQYDTLDNQDFTPRFHIHQQDNLNRDNVLEHLVEKIPPVNTGDPKNLTDFIVWSMKSYPSEKHALVLWNHGSGWKEDDIYARYRDAERLSKRDSIRSIGSRKRFMRRAFFIPTIGEIMSVPSDDIRAICYDDTSMDFLDNYELEKALSEAKKQTGKKLDLLGMDACLMSMVEVAYQVHTYADYMVSSQEVEEGTGWPYQDILGELVNTPDMSARDLSRVIVEKFGDYYMGNMRGGGGINTQSSIDLNAIPETFSRVKALAHHISSSYTSDLYAEIAVTRAQRAAESFQDVDYLDLRHLAQLIRDEYSGDLQLGEIAHDLYEQLDVGKSSSAIVDCFRGDRHQNANGVSIYFPAKRYSLYYDNQAFAHSGWNLAIRQVNQLPKPKLSALGKASISRAEAHRSLDVRLINCPICECELDVPTNIGEISLTEATKGVRDLMTQLVEAIQHALASPTQQVNQWIDLPCPNCSHTFLYHILTGETKR